MRSVVGHMAGRSWSRAGGPGPNAPESWPPHPAGRPSCSTQDRHDRQTGNGRGSSRQPEGRRAEPRNESAGHKPGPVPDHGSGSRIIPSRETHAAAPDHPGRCPRVSAVDRIVVGRRITRADDPPEARSDRVGAGPRQSVVDARRAQPRPRRRTFRTSRRRGGAQRSRRG